jgi:hypothetical protein
LTSNKFFWRFFVFTEISSSSLSSIKFPSCICPYVHMPLSWAIKSYLGPKAWSKGGWWPWQSDGERLKVWSTREVKNKW